MTAPLGQAAHQELIVRHVDEKLRAGRVRLRPANTAGRQTIAVGVLNRSQAELWAMGAFTCPLLAMLIVPSPFVILLHLFL